MGIHVTALNRGGYSAYGGCSYNPREGGWIELDVHENEVIDVVIEFPVTPTEFNYRETGIDASEPVIVGSTVTLQFQQLAACGTYEIDVFTASGAVRTVRFLAHEAQPFYTGSVTTTDDDDVDYGAFG